MLDAVRRDVIVVATGSDGDLTGYRPDRASIPGLRHARTMGLDEAVLTGAAGPGSRLLIVDESGESAAAAFAIAVAEAGAHCTVVTPLAAYSDVFNKTYELPYFFGRMERAGVSLRQSSTLEEIRPGGTIALKSLMSGRIEPVQGADLLVFASGKLPRIELVQPLRQEGYDVRVVGDARAPRSIEAVIAEGDAAGRGLLHSS